MRKQHCFRILYKRGFTLLEVMISMALLAGVIFGFLLWVQSFQSAVGNLNKNEQVDSAFIKTMAAFGNNDKYCEFILRGKMLMPNLPLSLASIDFYNESGLALGNVLTVSKPVQARSDVITESILLRSVTQLSSAIMIADLEVTFSRKSSGVSVKQIIVRKMPLMITVNTGNIIETCSASAESFVVVQRRLCEIQNDGYENYDVSAKQCVLNPNVQWFKGSDPKQVSCPVGWKPAVSPLNPFPEYVACLSETDSTFPVPERTYSSGTVLKDKLPVWSATMDSTKTKCLFAFPTNVSPSLYTSKIKCVQAGP